MQYANTHMDKTTLPTLSDEMMAELRLAARIAVSGVRDPAVIKEAVARMRQVREEIFRRQGLLDIGVPALHEFRDRDEA